MSVFVLLKLENTLYILILALYQIHSLQILSPRLCLSFHSLHLQTRVIQSSLILLQAFHALWISCCNRMTLQESIVESEV